MKRSPVEAHTNTKYGYNRSRKPSHSASSSSFPAYEGSPSITVSSIDVHSKIQQELDYVVVSRAHCVVQGCDAFVIGSAGIFHLEKGRTGTKKDECLNYIHI